MTTLQKIKLIAQTANTSGNLLTDEMLEEVMPKIIDAINAQCKEIGYDGITYNRPASEYPNGFYGLLWLNPIQQVVLDYLEAKHPMAWFKPMYFDSKKQEEFMKTTK